jgi:hypothetical protein
MQPLAVVAAAEQTTQPQVPFWLQVLSIALAPIFGFAGVAIGTFLSERNNRIAYIKDE